MKIIQFGPYPLDISCIRGGVESSVYGLANALSHHHEVNVFDLPRIGGDDMVDTINNTKVHRYKNIGPHNQDAVQRVEDILRDMIDLYPDIVHIHGTGHISALVYKALKKQGVKVLLTIHGLLHIEKKNQLRKKFSLKHVYQYSHQSCIEFDVLENTTVAIVDTEYVAIQLRKILKEKKVKRLPEMHVIPQGINSAYLALNANPLEKIVLSVGAISERKGHLHLIKAFEHVCATIPDAKLVIAGSLADKAYYQLLLDYIAKSPYKQQIEIKVNLPQEQIFQLYQEATIFALHSQEESQGIVFAEAMAVGLPVVSTNVGGIPYVVHDSINGFLSEYGDVTSFADNIKKVLSNKEVRQQMINSNKVEAIKYDWSVIADRVMDLYRVL